MRDFFEGMMDIHVHCAPDVVERKVDDLTLIEAASKAGLAGYVIKAHYESTIQKANLLSKLFPKVKVAGSITLNHAVGGINPYAVETAAILGARVVWFPTFDCTWQLPLEMEYNPRVVPMQCKLRGMGQNVSPIRLLDDAGKLLPEVHTVLELIAEHDLVLASGHISKEESFELFREARDKGVRRMVLTHVDWSDNRYSIEEQREHIKLGAMVEHGYVNYLFGAASKKITWDEICSEIRAAGPDNVLYSTDMGQPQFKTPLEGLEECVDKLYASGFSDDDIDTIFRKNPKNIIF